MEYRNIVVERDNAAVTISFNRPKVLNALLPRKISFTSG